MGLAANIRRAAMLLVVPALLIIVVDWLAGAASGGVNNHAGGWWGPQQESPWSDAVSSENGLRLNSRHLLITIKGDKLTAQYTVTVPSDSIVAAVAAADDSPDSGNDLTGSVLGTVQVREFRYGLTGPDYASSSLDFQEPQLRIKGRVATVTVESSPFRLFLPRQQISVTRPRGVTVRGLDQVSIEAPSVQVGDTSGAVTSGITGGGAILHPKRRVVTTTVWEGNSGQGWLDGLRALGGDRHSGR